MNKKFSIVAVSLCLLFALTFSFLDIIELVTRYLFRLNVAEITPPTTGEVCYPTTDPCPDPPFPPPPPPPPKGG